MQRDPREGLHFPKHVLHVRRRGDPLRGRGGSCLRGGPRLCGRPRLGVCPCLGGGLGLSVCLRLCGGLCPGGRLSLCLGGGLRAAALCLCEHLPLILVH